MILDARKASPYFRQRERVINSPFGRFSPRPDQPIEMDEQTSFVKSKAKFAVLLGGTGSGKTEAASFRTAHRVLVDPPPRPRTPFWIVGETYPMVCGVCWVEKLRKYIPPSRIHSVDWYKERRQWPFAVNLKHPTIPGEVGWMLEFKSYAQGRAMMQAASIGGYWLNEECPFDLVEEVRGRCREYDSPGWADFTPIECKDANWIEAYENPPANWDFFHLNSLCNTAIAPGGHRPINEWAEEYLRTVPADMRETRRVGTFASRRGAVYKDWRKKLHVVEPFEFPKDTYRARAIDFGYVNAFVCLWAGRMPRDIQHGERTITKGTWVFYDEHYEAERLLGYHASRIKDRAWQYGNAFYGPCYADHDAQDAAELRAHGVATVPANKDVWGGIELIQKLLMPNAVGCPGILVTSNCENLIREFPAYRYPEGTKINNPRELPVAKADHALDAARYLCFSEHKRSVGPMPDALKVQAHPWMEDVAGKFLLPGER